jgi:uncharacterized paraquat-inducible protein A
MGLGPMVCLHCEIFLMLDDTHTWHCPRCNEKDYVDYQWMFTEEDQTRITNNSKLYRFVLGKE